MAPGLYLHGDFVAAGEVGVNVQRVLDVNPPAGFPQAGGKLAGEHPQRQGAIARVVQAQVAAALLQNQPGGRAGAHHGHFARLHLQHRGVADLGVLGVVFLIGDKPGAPPVGVGPGGVQGDLPLVLLPGLAPDDVDVLVVL